MHPDNAVAKHVIAGTSGLPALQAEVEAWRERFGMFAPARSDPGAD